ncbi:uncharacterized protein LOC131661819 isoform X2 [Vicia villosa]|uniref:uncharacterized protein LOC131661819 isoform X2 n=1 Tax=Vicia villosa TaxID=3911 RepID=UPI00273AAC5C|nr:uncharacterized protein LOC131661819 isoform X2 [Vicia villosa]XP_058787442.1 uncharacterized protein LOC131661819 isoform X2 [Vicia villosa]
MPKPRRITNFLKLANQSSTHVASVPNDSVHNLVAPLAPNLVSTTAPIDDHVSTHLPHQASSQPSQQSVESSHLRENVSSQLPNQTSLQTTQQRAESSHRRANVTSQLPNQTSSQPSEQRAESSHLKDNVSSQLPSQTSSQSSQQSAESSHLRANVSSQLNKQASSQPSQQRGESSQHRGGRASTHYWLVDAQDKKHGAIQKLRLTYKDVNDMPNNLRIIVEFDEFHSPIGEAAGLLAGVCGLLATNSLFFPIGFDKWSDMPEEYFDEQWKNLFEPRFCFKVHEDLAKRYIEGSIGKKWKEYRGNLWKAKNNPLLSKSEIIKNRPGDVPLDHWALFVEYRSKPETMDLCKRNQQIRKKQLFSHTCGAKSLARRRHELTIESGKTIGRGIMWNMTHKKKDGSYVNEKAKEIGEKIDQHLNQNPEASAEISSNDVVGKVLGREHPGRVRAMGMGVVPTTAFKHTTTRLSGMDFGSSSGSTSSGSSSLVEQRLASVTALLEAVVGYISKKEGGTLPVELAAVLANQTQQASEVESEPPSPCDIRRSSDASNTHEENHQSPS